MEGIINEVRDELIKASAKFPPMNSGHEGYAVIKEELEELWKEVKKYPRAPKTLMRKEAVQIAAMAIRFVIDCCEE